MSIIITGMMDDALTRSPIAGMDMQVFKNYWLRAMAGDENIPSEFTIFTNSLSEDLRPETKKKREWEELLQVLWLRSIQNSLQDIDRQIHELNEMSGEYANLALQAQGRMEHAADELGKIDDFVTGVGDLDEKFDRNKIITLLKSRGIEIGGNESDKSLIVKLSIEKEQVIKDRQKWSDAHNEAERDAKRYDEKAGELKKQAAELVEHRDHIRGLHLSPADEARELQKVSEEYEKKIQEEAAKLELEKRHLEETAKALPSQKVSAQDAFMAEDNNNLRSKFTLAASNIQTPIPPPPKLTPPTNNFAI